MIKYVPEFIFESYERGQTSGSFCGYTLFFDIKDFTRITEALTHKGHKGAEVINKILEDAFSPVIEAVEAEGGFVTGFAGDAFMAVFNNVQGDNILSVYQVIKQSLAQAPVIPEVADEFRIDARLSVTFGEIQWRILTNPWQNEYYFFGSAIEECNSFAEFKKDVIFSHGAVQAIGEEYFMQSAGVYVPKPLKFPILATNKRHYQYSPETVNDFINTSYSSIKAENEIRDISSAFIYLDKIPEDDLNRSIEIIAELSDKYNAFFNKLDYSDKGLLGILIFGAPHRYEKTLERMMFFAMEVSKQLCSVKMGISSGRVYAGFTGSADCQEYTILGYPPNLASRLMMKASLNQTLVDVFSYEQLLNRYSFENLGKITMKGFADELPVYKLLSEKQVFETSPTGFFCGRNTELKTVIDCLKNNELQQQPQVLYIHGDPGMGKSRLLNEARLKVDVADKYWCFLLCDGILRQPYSPVIRFLSEFFDVDQTLDIEVNQQNFEKKWKSLQGNDAEMERIKSIIGQFLDYHWEESVWEILPPEARPLQERIALVNFFLKLASDKGVIIHLEDGQWIDGETLEFMKALCRIEKTHLNIFVCCRYHADGSLNSYEFTTSEKSIKLGKLSDKISNELVCHILNIKKLPEKTAELIIKKGQGNPLFLEQITLYLKEQNYLDDNADLTKDIDTVTAFGITDIIGARIDNLADEIRELVYYASVLGVEFDVQILSQMLDYSLNKEIDEVVDNCIWVRLKELHYLFSQILFRDTVYDRMLQEKKKSLNKLAAESYQKIYNKQELKPFYEIMGLHYERAEIKKGAYACYAAAFFVAYRNMRLNKALELAQKSLAIKLEVLDENDILIAQSYNCLGLVYYAMGQYRKALDYTLQALPLFEMKEAKPHLIVALLNNAGNAYSQLGQFDNALDYYGKSMLIRSIELGENHPDYAQSIMHMGNVYFHTNRFKEALQHYQKALRILKNYRESAPGKLISCYNNLAAFYLKKREQQKALEYLGRALPILEENDSLDKPRGAAIFRQIGFAQSDAGDIKEALTNLFRALDIEEKFFGTDHSQTADTYYYIGTVYSKSEDYDKALLFLNKALSIYLKYRGEKHPATAYVYYYLGKCYLSKQQLDKARDTLLLSKDLLLSLNVGDDVLDDINELINKIG